MAENNVEVFDEENSVTMLDVLQEENQLEEDAYAVLGASDDKNCTYNKVDMRLCTQRFQPIKHIRFVRFQNNLNTMPCRKFVIFIVVLYSSLEEMRRSSKKYPSQAPGDFYLPDADFLNSCLSVSSRVTFVRLYTPARRAAPEQEPEFVWRVVSNATRDTS